MRTDLSPFGFAIASGIGMNAADAWWAAKGWAGAMTNRLVAVTMLERLGFLVDIAANGFEAVEAVRSRPYDIVLMDLHLAVGNGLDATARITADLPGTAVLVLTMVENDDAVANALKPVEL